jgi:pimeloyl-ACP methyl ester carboxylesterase
MVEALAAAAGEPIVLGGHSYGGVVALAVALRRRARVRGLALFEPVACPVLLAVGDADGYAVATTFAADYYARVERGEPRAVEKMVTLWFGEGAFDRMPPPVQAFLAANAARNVLDIRRTMSERYSLDALRALPMPVLIAYGSRSPALTLQIASALAANAARGSLVRIDGATHSLVSTHVDEVAGVMERLAAGGD